MSYPASASRYSSNRSAASGYRRYTAQHAVDLIKIRTLAEAGVPLARIRELRTASDEQFQHVLHRVDGDLSARIRGLRATQRRLRQLAAGPRPRPGCASTASSVTGWGSERQAGL